MTSDGINKADWDIIQNYAARIAAAICNDQEGVSIDLTERLLKSLSQLEAKYGRLPSIVATEADYTHDQASRVKLLEEAFLLATEREDTSNQALSASSLAETFLEEMPDLHAAQRWLDALGEALGEKWDDSEYKEFNRLVVQFESLRQKVVQS